MANKVIGFRLEFEGASESIKQLSRFELELENVKKALKETSKELAAANNANDTERIKRLTDEYERLKASQLGLTQSIKDSKKAIADQQKEFKNIATAEGSYRQLQQQLSNINKQIRELSAAERESDFGKGLAKQSLELQDQLKEIDASVGIFVRNVGNYENAVVNALRRAGSEDTLKQKLQSVNEQLENSKRKSAELGDAYEKALKTNGAKAAQAFVNEISKVEDDIKRLTTEAKDLGNALSDVQGESGSGSSVSARRLGRLGKFAAKVSPIAQAAPELGGFVGGLGETVQTLQGLPPVAAAAFGVFAAGGLIFKGIQALSGLNKEISMLQGEIAKVSNLSGAQLQNTTANVKALAATFEVETGDITKNAATISQKFGVSFDEALGVIEKGFLAGANASGNFLDTISGASQAAGLSVEELTAILAKSSEVGVFSERGVELFSTAGEALQKQSTKAKDALTDAFGEQFTDDLFKNIANGSVTSAQGIDQIIQKLDDTGVSANDAGKVLEDVFGGELNDQQLLKNLEGLSSNLDDYINKNNTLTRIQEEQLRVNKQLSQAQVDLGNTAADLGITTETVGTQIQAGLLNAANSFLLFIDSTYGDGVAAAKAGLNDATRAANEQQKVVDELQGTYEPLLQQYDDLTAQLATLNPESEEAAKVNAELTKVVDKLGERLPIAATGFDEFGNAIGFSTAEARKFIGEQNVALENLQRAQLGKAGETLQKLQEQQAKYKKILETQTKELAVGDYASIISPLIGSSIPPIELTANNDDLIEAANELQRIQKEIGNVSGQLEQTDWGRAVLEFNSQLKEGNASVLELFTNFGKFRKAASDQPNTAATTIATPAVSAGLDEEGKKRIEEARRKAEEFRKKLIDEEQKTGDARAAFLRSQSESAIALQTQLIENEYDRRLREINLSAEKQLETEKEAAEKSAQERTSALLAIAERVDTDAILRAEYGSKEEILAYVGEINAETEQAIKAQTELVNRLRAKQVKDLEKERLAAQKEALKGITSQRTTADTEQTQAQLSQTQGEIQKIQIEFEYNTARSESAFAKQQADLDNALATGQIMQATYDKKLGELDLARAEERRRLEVAKLEQLKAFQEQEFELQRQLLQRESEARQQAIQADFAARQQTITEQLNSGLLTQEQAAEASLQNEQILNQRLAAENTTYRTQEQVAEREFINAQFAQQQTAADAEIQLEAEKAKQKQAIWQNQLKEFNEGAETVKEGVVGIANAITAIQDAAAQKQIDGINARYEQEMQAAGRNAGLVAELEKKRDAEIAEIQRKQARRKQAIAIGEAGINGALAVTKILAETPDPTGIFTAIRIAAAIATTIAQIAAISAQKFARGGELISSLASGSPSSDSSDAIPLGVVQGKSHAEGGVKTPFGEIEGGEFLDVDENGALLVINKHSTNLHRKELEDMKGRIFPQKRAYLSAINAHNGFGRKFANGGELFTPAPIPQLPPSPQQNAQAVLTSAIVQNNQNTQILQDNVAALQRNLEELQRVVLNLKVYADPVEIAQQATAQSELIKANTL